MAAEPPQRELLLFDEPTVSAATKSDELVRDVPSSVTVVTHEEILRFGYRTLAEILRSVRGFYGSYDRSYDYVGVRGFLVPGDFNDRILLLVNGHTYNDDVYQDALLGREFGIDLEAIERVEVIRGPGSALYGGNALFAVVNVVTRDGAQVDGVESLVEYGSFNEKRGHVLAGKRFGDAEVFASGSVYDTDGPGALRFPQGVAVDLDGQRAYDLFVSSSYRGWRLQGGANRREKQIPTGAFDTTFGDPDTRIVDSRRFAEVSRAGRPYPTLTVTGRAFYDSYHYHGTYAYGAVTNQDSSLSNWLGGELRARWQAWRANALTVGAEYTYHPDANQLSYDTPHGRTYVDDHRTFSTWGLYGQDEWALTSTLRLTAGLRYDEVYDGQIRELSPRGGLVWHALEPTTLKLLVGRAFRPPNLLEQYYAYGGSGAVYLANPDLDPERITTYEAALEQDLWFGARGELSLYRNEIDGLVEWEQLPSRPGAPDRFQYRNVRDVEAHGAEIELRVPLPLRAQLRTHYAVQEATSDGQGLSNSPRSLGGLLLQVPLPFGIRAGAELLVVGSRRTRTGRRLEPAKIANLTVMAPLPRPLKGFSLNASGYNLLGQHYPDPAGPDIRSDRIPQDGRTFRIQLTYAF